MFYNIINYFISNLFTPSYKFDNTKNYKFLNKDNKNYENTFERLKKIIIRNERNYFILPVYYNKE